MKIETIVYIFLGSIIIGVALKNPLLGMGVSFCLFAITSKEE
jgi:hypothetical protein